MEKQKADSIAVNNVIYVEVIDFEKPVCPTTRQTTGLTAVCQGVGQTGFFNV